MAPKSPADRVRATRLRHRVAEGEELDDNDQAWLDSYEDKSAVSASATERVVHIEERAAAQGEHPHPEAYAAIATAEGLRADTLLRIASQALIQVNDQYFRMAEHLMQRTIAIETAHVQMLEAIREERLARIEAEAEARMSSAIDNAAGDDEEFATLLKYLLMAKQNPNPDAAKKVKKKVPRKSKKPLGEV